MYIVPLVLTQNKLISQEPLLHDIVIDYSMELLLYYIIFYYIILYYIILYYIILLLYLKVCVSFP